MRVYQRVEGSAWVCGYWNGSPLQVAVSEVMRAVRANEVYHSHTYHEYYIVLHGRGRLLVEGREVTLEAGSVTLVEPGERHRLSWVDAEVGLQWVVVKERSEPNSKRIEAEPDVGREAGAGET